MFQFYNNKSVIWLSTYFCFLFLFWLLMPWRQYVRHIGYSLGSVGDRFFRAPFLPLEAEGTRYK